jgi:hypothetical protein
MDDDAVLFVLCDELREIFVKVFDHIRADGVRALASFAPIRYGIKCRGAAFQTALGVVV